MEINSENWKKRFEKADSERHELADVLHAIRSGQVDTIRTINSPSSGLLRLLDSSLVTENEQLLEKLKKQSESLRQQNEKLTTLQLKQQLGEKTIKSLLDSQLDSAILIDKQGKVLALNQEAAAQMGLSEEEILDKCLYSLLPAELKAKRKQCIIDAIKSGQSIQYEEINKAAIFDVHIFPIVNLAGETNRVSIFIHDISEERENELQLTRLANYDQLTGLNNRSFFFTHQHAIISQAVRNKKRLATLFIDLDNFKVVNDTWGHDVGDELLISVSQRIKGCIRDSDLVARIGGDEFAVLMNDISDPRQAAIVAQKIIDALAFPHQLSNREIYAHCSVGIACYPEMGKNLSAMNKAADIAMYHAKELGRNRYCFYDPELQLENLKRTALINQLRLALKNDGFTLLYQPKVCAKNKNIVSVEALIRWPHSGKPPFGPSFFIPLAEEIGIISELGEWVLRRACYDAKSMIKQMGQFEIPDFSIAVNVSARQLKDIHLADTIKNIVDEFEIPADLIQIELTETSIMENPKASIKVLNEIRDLGISIAIDDFGTGYSSLSYLSKLPVDTLKIDLMFVQEIGKDPQSESIVKSIFALAQSLGLKTVAEGVETEEQIKFLTEQGCDYLQGFYFSKAIDKDKIIEMLVDENKKRKKNS